jgi:hypothetical protein
LKNGKDRGLVSNKQWVAKDLDGLLLHESNDDNPMGLANLARKHRTLQLVQD